MRNPNMAMFLLWTRRSITTDCEDGPGLTVKKC
jgi:hypothetical protein